MSKNTKRNTILLLVLLVLLILVPILMDNLYYIGILTSIFINILLVASFWLIMTTGQINLGHAAFASIGAYISAALTLNAGFPTWMSMIGGILSAGFIALIIGLITLRITGPYFFIVTIAIGEIQRIVFQSMEVFGTQRGLSNLPPPDPVNFFGLFKLEFADKIPMYYFTLFFVMLGIILVYRIHKSSMGLIFRGISNSNKLASHVGINIMRYKVIAFVSGCMCAGLAGVLYTYVTTTIQPSGFTNAQSLNYIVWAAVGGMNTFAGPIVGGIVLNILTEYFRSLAEYLPIFNGVLLILAILLFRGGLWGLFRMIGGKIAGLVKKAA